VAKKQTPVFDSPVRKSRRLSGLADELAPLASNTRSNSTPIKQVTQDPEQDQDQPEPGFFQSWTRIRTQQLKQQETLIQEKSKTCQVKAETVGRPSKRRSMSQVPTNSSVSPSRPETSSISKAGLRSTADKTEDNNAGQTKSSPRKVHPAIETVTKRASRSSPKINPAQPAKVVETKAVATKAISTPKKATSAKLQSPPATKGTPKKATTANTVVKTKPAAKEASDKAVTAVKSKPTTALIQAKDESDESDPVSVVDPPSTPQRVSKRVAGTDKAVVTPTRRSSRRLSGSWTTVDSPMIPPKRRRSSVCNMDNTMSQLGLPGIEEVAETKLEVETNQQKEIELENVSCADEISDVPCNEEPLAEQIPDDVHDEVSDEKNILKTHKKQVLENIAEIEEHPNNKSIDAASTDDEKLVIDEQEEASQIEKADLLSSSPKLYLEHKDISEVSSKDKSTEYKNSADLEPEDHLVKAKDDKQTLKMVNDKSTENQESTTVVEIEDHLTGAKDNKQTVDLVIENSDSTDNKQSSGHEGENNLADPKDDKQTVDLVNKSVVTGNKQSTDSEDHSVEAKTDKPGLELVTDKSDSSKNGSVIEKQVEVNEIDDNKLAKTDDNQKVKKVKKPKAAKTKSEEELKMEKIQSFLLNNIPRQKPKSGKFWKSQRHQFQAIKKDKGQRKTFDERIKQKQEKLQSKQLESLFIEERIRKKKELAERIELNKKRKEERQTKNEVYQIVTDPNKIKKMKKRDLVKRDILNRA